jgi:cell division protein FtsW (lipid II flippase)
MNEPNIKRFWENLNNAKLIRYLLLFALGWAIIQVLAYFGTVLIVFIFAGVLAFLLSYPVKWIEHFLPHTVAVTIVFLFSLLFNLQNQSEQKVTNLKRLFTYYKDAIYRVFISIFFYELPPSYSPIRHNRIIKICICSL